MIKLILWAGAATALMHSPLAAEVVALSPAEIEAAKEAGARRNAEAATLGIEPARGLKIHGEVGFAIGTGGYTALYGTAIAPLGDDGFVAVSFARENYGNARRRR